MNFQEQLLSALGWRETLCALQRGVTENTSSAVNFTWTQNYIPLCNYTILCRVISLFLLLGDECSRKKQCLSFFISLPLAYNSE